MTRKVFTIKTAKFAARKSLGVELLLSKNKNLILIWVANAPIQKMTPLSLAKAQTALVGIHVIRNLTTSYLISLSTATTRPIAPLALIRAPTIKAKSQRVTASPKSATVRDLQVSGARPGNLWVVKILKMP